MELRTKDNIQNLSKKSIILMFFIFLSCFILTGCDNLMTKPNSAQKILKTLEERYNKKFVFGKEIPAEEDNDRKYIVYPKDNSKIEVIVDDDYDSDLWSGSSRIIKDNYVTELLRSDSDNIKKVYDEGYAAGTDMDIGLSFELPLTTQYNGNLIVNIPSYESVPEIAKKVFKMKDYFEKSKLYKKAKIPVRVKFTYDNHNMTDGIWFNTDRQLAYDDIELSTPEKLEKVLTSELLTAYRLYNDPKIFNIPLNVREQYPLYLIKDVYLYGELYKHNLAYIVRYENNEYRLTDFIFEEMLEKNISQHIEMLNVTDFSIDIPSNGRKVSAFKTNDKSYLLVDVMYEGMRLYSNDGNYTVITEPSKSTTGDTISCSKLKEVFNIKVCGYNFEEEKFEIK